MFKEPGDVYVLSRQFARGFTERYGIDVEILVVRYEKVEDM